MDRKATYTRTGRNEWGATYTVSAWDAEMDCNREIVIGVSRDAARRMCGEINSHGATNATATVQVRMTLAQRERLGDFARDFNMTISQYVRQCCGL